jgi:hypothetical protein
MLANDIRQKAVPEEAMTFATSKAIELGDFMTAEKLAKSVAWAECGIYGQDYWLIAHHDDEELFALATVSSR